MERTDGRSGKWLKALGFVILVLGVMVAFQLSDSRADAQTIKTRMRAGNSGKCLAVYPGDFSNGAITYQWACGSGNNIQIEDAGGGWHYIKFTHSGKCLTVHGYAWWDGGTLDQWDCVGQSNQKWSGNFVEGIFEVHASQANPTKCITVHGESRLDGAWVNQWQCLYQSNQAWILDTAGATPTPTATRTRTPTPTPTATLVPGDGTLTITKVCDPSNDPGQFVIRVAGVSQGTVNCTTTTSVGPITLAAGFYKVSETAGTGTDLDDYVISFSGDCDSDGDVVIQGGQHFDCIITNDSD
jgi:hypothetical protein